MNKTTHISKTSTLHKTILKSVMIGLLGVLTQCAPSGSSDDNPGQQDSSMVFINETHPKLKGISPVDLIQKKVLLINRQPYIIYDSSGRHIIGMIYANCVSSGKNTRSPDMPIIEYQDLSGQHQGKTISLSISIAGIAVLHNDFDKETLDYFLEVLTKLNSDKPKLK